MSIQAQFNAYLTAIALDQARISRITSATDRLAAYCRSDLRISAYRPAIFFQGSYANNLAVRPADPKGEYDVDLVVLMSFAQNTGATAVLDWLTQRLALDADYRGRIMPPKDKCVRLNYAGDFHVDVVPAYRVTDDGSKIQIPSRKSGWLYSHPKGYTRWCSEQSVRTSRDFNRTVKAMKRWRDVTQDAQRAIKSIVFAALLGPYVPTPPGAETPDAIVIAQTLSSVNEFLRRQMIVPVISNPSLLEENLTSTWSQSNFLLFCTQFDAATNLALRACNASDERVASMLWRQVFGDSFPLS